MPDARSPVLWYGLFCCWLTLWLGCGGPGLGKPTTASGKVTVDGEPLSGATVAFHCTGERAAEYRSFTATTGGSGEYTIPHIYPGSYEVVVVEAASGTGGAGGDVGMASALAGQDLKPAAGGELRAEVTADDGVVFDIQLTRQAVELPPQE